jgi:hypothetical protein
MLKRPYLKEFGKLTNILHENPLENVSAKPFETKRDHLRILSKDICGDFCCPGRKWTTGWPGMSQKQAYTLSPFGCGFVGES